MITKHFAFGRLPALDSSLKSLPSFLSDRSFFGFRSRLSQPARTVSSKNSVFSGLSILLFLSLPLGFMPGCTGPGNSPAPSGEREGSSPAQPATSNNALSPLMTATTSGDVAKVNELLAQGANPNESTQTGVTPLMTASGMGHLEVVGTLLSRGADVNARTPGGYTALMSAALNNHRPVVELLLKKGADPNAKDISNRTAMDYAASQNDTEIVELLKKVSSRK